MSARRSGERPEDPGLRSADRKPLPESATPRPKNPVPAYSKHPRNDSARCWWGGRWVTLGKYLSPESRAEYARLCAEAGGPPRPDPAAATVAEVLARFRAWCEAYYVRPDGTRTKEVAEFRYALRPVRELYGHTPAREFGPVALKAVRRAFVDAGWCRSRVNKPVGRVRRAFRWAVGQELVPEAAAAIAPAVRAGCARQRPTGLRPEEV
jgi:hypothetical protein